MKPFRWWGAVIVCLGPTTAAAVVLRSHADVVTNTSLSSLGSPEQDGTCMEKVSARRKIVRTCNAKACLGEVPTPEWWLPLSVGFGLSFLIATAALAIFRRGDSAPSEDSEGPKEHVYFVDNCRFLLECFVIYVHWSGDGLALGDATNPPGHCFWLGISILNWMKTFAMPGFAFCCGLLSKGSLTVVRLQRIVQRVVVPYLLVNFLVYSVAYHEMAPHPKSFWVGYITSPWDLLRAPMWFLIAWLEWRIIVGALLAPFPPFTAVAICYIISWFSGYWMDTGYATAQALSFLGIYATGHAIPLQSLRHLNHPKVRIAGAIVSIAIFGVHALAGYLSSISLAGESYDYIIHFSGYWVSVFRFRFFKEPFEAIETTPLLYYTAWMQRLTAQFLIAWPTVLGLLALVPHSKVFFTKSGTRTMYAYLFHMVIIASLEWFIPHIVIGPISPLRFAATFVASVALNLFLCSDATHCWAKYIVEPTWMGGVFTPKKELEDMVIKDAAAIEAQRVKAKKLSAAASDDHGGSGGAAAQSIPREAGC